jgi:thiosulfate dehydrogenase [quinone] large subunit
VSATAATPAAATPAVPVSRELEGTAKASWGYTLLGLTRLMVGFTFLWAFLDKVFGLGFSTPTEHSWLHGGSPTSGFLVASIEGGNPFAGVWSVFLAINPVTDVLFMLGLLGVGLALMLGIGTRVAAVSGAAMYTLMYLAAFPMSTNPLYDTHLLLAVAVLAMAGLAAGDHLGHFPRLRRAPRRSLSRRGADRPRWHVHRPSSTRRAARPHRRPQGHASAPRGR